MTTFTTEDREHAFGTTINVEPIPFAGWINTESNISMIGGIYPKKLEEYLNSLEARIKELEVILKKAQEK
jgi:hypothetical protein